MGMNGEVWVGCGDHLPKNLTFEAEGWGVVLHRHEVHHR